MSKCGITIWRFWFHRKPQIEAMHRKPILVCHYNGKDFQKRVFWIGKKS